MAGIKSLKLISGEEVVAEVVEIKNGNQLLTENSPYIPSATSYVIRRPHTLQFQQIGPGQIGLAFVPWCLSNPSIEKIEIPATSVTVMFDPASNVERQYLEQTSGISLAGAPSSFVKT